MIAFGPVPSRRLGRSLGINNIPPKVCTYSCIYCQRGPTRVKRGNPGTFYRAEKIHSAVVAKVKKAQEMGEPIDYLTFVSEGEPTLDNSLGREIELLKPLGIRIGVISNASLLWHQAVRDDLAKADWVSLKVDSTDEEVWREINRPHKDFTLKATLDGITEFAKVYRGKLVTETMLVKGVNDSERHLEQLADFLSLVKPFRTYLSIPIRPPAENWVHPPDVKTMVQSYHIMSKKLDCVELLMGYEGNVFVSTGNIEEDLLSIGAVHPMRKDAVKFLLERAKADWPAVQNLIDHGKLVELEYEGKRFFVKKFPGHRCNR
jgi:wyosine [tRNA(Phe)-imidazoG37] synthetase (radical SAM superfamily)